MEGLHLTADLHACRADAAALRDVEALRRLCIASVEAAGLQPVAQVFHVFPEAGGVTGVVLLAESHLAVHTWPERDAVTLDVYVCNYGQDNSAKAQRLMDALVEAFAPGRIERHALRRGMRQPVSTAERDERRAAPSRPAIPSGDRPGVPPGEGTT